MCTHGGEGHGGLILTAGNKNDDNEEILKVGIFYLKHQSTFMYIHMSKLTTKSNYSEHFTSKTIKTIFMIVSALNPISQS